MPPSGFSNYCNLIRLATKKMTCIHTECFQHFHLCFSEYATFFLAFISFKFLKNPLVQKIGNTCYRKCTASVCGFLVQTPCSKPNLKFLLYYFLTQVISDLILLVITFRWAAVKISCHWTPHWKSFVSSNRIFFFLWPWLPRPGVCIVKLCWAV